MMDPVLLIIIVAVILTIILAALGRIDVGVALLIVFAALTLWLIAGSPRFG